MKKIVLSPTTSSPVGLYGFGNAGWAASQAWHAMGNHRFGVREVPSSNPGGEPPFLKVSVSNEIGYKHEVGLGLITMHVEYSLYFMTEDFDEIII